MKINNKGFTLIEVLSVLIIISIIMLVGFKVFQSTFSASKEEAYKIMKNNILAVSYDYIQECNVGLVSCDFSFEKNNRFTAKKLQESGYFKNLESPIDGKDLGACLILEASMSNGVVLVDLVDKCY